MPLKRHHMLHPLHLNEVSKENIPAYIGFTIKAFDPPLCTTSPKRIERTTGTKGCWFQKGTWAIVGRKSTQTQCIWGEQKHVVSKLERVGQKRISMQCKAWADNRCYLANAFANISACPRKCSLSSVKRVTVAVREAISPSKLPTRAFKAAQWPQ